MILQPVSIFTRLLDAGAFVNSSLGLIGRSTKLPPQFGQIMLKIVSAQARQKVHSNVQMTAVFDSGTRSLSQHSQFGLISNMFRSYIYLTIETVFWFHYDRTVLIGNRDMNLRCTLFFHTAYLVHF